ncbi:hypothetical protein DEV92_104255 [Phyllobacterium myrsinacearum]|nr:hypothetical protein DEV92_104255 [Phyllobacterium myrsinacearum]RZS77838.1 hypothetical protein EV217_4505 [Phyllobacterium myrsinacearum]RZV04814.1 hypothetical protein EV654_3620 [Phyllobacterium myrsinacearum]
MDFHPTTKLTSLATGKIRIHACFNRTVQYNLVHA